MHPRVKSCTSGAGCTLNFGHCLTVQFTGKFYQLIETVHVLVPIIGTWHLLSAPLLLGLSNIKIIIFSVELVLSTFIRWLKVINRASGLFDIINS